MPADDSRGLLLSGLDGSNPLAFLAAIGILRVLGDGDGFTSSIRLGWRNAQGAWRPLLTGCGSNQREVGTVVLNALKGASMTAFDIGRESRNGKVYDKFPFAPERLVRVLKARQGKACLSDRRDVDFLASFGTELYPDTKRDEFQGTHFRMVRSGDSSRQGLLRYAKRMRENLDRDHVERTLFQAWDYRDEGHGLRWDPIEDQPYALRWRDPSRSCPADGPGTMRAANCLAVEALRCFPTVAVGRRVRTTGFHRTERQGLRFVWPIWTPMVNMETLRSLLALRDLEENPLPRSAIFARGIEEVYCVHQVRPNEYYRNFTPGEPAI